MRRKFVVSYFCNRMDGAAGFGVGTIVIDDGRLPTERELRIFLESEQRRKGYAQMPTTLSISEISPE